MSFAQASGYIDKASAVLELNSIGYTGGEVFLCFPLLRKLIDYAYQNHGVHQGAVTNCSWATSDDIAAQKLRELHLYGLRYLTVSCDSFHSEYIPVDRVRRVVHAALDLGIMVCVNAVVTKTGSISKQNLPELLSLSTDEMQHTLSIKEFSPLRVGRAVEQCPSNELICTSDERWFNGSCPYVKATPTICPDGSLFACCCFGDAEQMPASQIGYVGNVESTDFQSTVARMEHDLLFTLLSTRGPYSLLQDVIKREPNVCVRRKYLTNCEVCVELYHNPAVREVLSDTLHALSESLLE